MMDQNANADEIATERDWLKRLGAQVAALSNGDRALLRRLYLVQSSSSRSNQADGVVAMLMHLACIPVPVSAEEYEAWRLTAHAAALIAGTGTNPQSPHDPSRSLGRALQISGYSENRLLRLTAARGSTLVDQITRGARMLARSDQGQGNRRGVNLRTLFDLAGPQAAKAKAARLQIAKDYYAAAARSGQEKSE